MLRIFAAALLGLVLTGCGYDGHYRYPCQDPANWEKAECKPPICDVSKTCPLDLNTNIQNETTGVKTNG